MQTAKSVNSKQATDKNIASFDDESISREIKALKTDIASIGERMTKIANTGARQVRHRGEETALSAKHQTDLMLEDLMQQLEEIEGKAGKAVRDNPIRSLGIAAGVGFLAAFLLRR